MNIENLSVNFIKVKYKPILGNNFVTTHVVRLKLFRLNQTSPKASTRQGLKGSEEHDCRISAECDSCTEHGFKMRFSLTVFSLQPIHLSNYIIFSFAFIRAEFECKVIEKIMFLISVFKVKLLLIS